MCYMVTLDYTTNVLVRFDIPVERNSIKQVFNLVHALRPIRQLVNYLAVSLRTNCLMYSKLFFYLIHFALSVTEPPLAL